MILISSGFARVFITSIVCGKTSEAIKKEFDEDSQERKARVIASAAAVPSSSIEALAISIPVKSIIIC